MTKAERLKAKLQQEAQDDGTLKPDVDVEGAEGTEINPHVPKFIADAPWYMADDTSGKASLLHQKYVFSIS